MNPYCVIKCPNCVVEKIHLFFLAGETESVFESPIGTLGMSFIMVLEMPPMNFSLNLRTSGVFKIMCSVREGPIARSKLTKADVLVFQ